MLHDRRRDEDYEDVNVRKSQWLPRLDLIVLSVAGGLILLGFILTVAASLSSSYRDWTTGERLAVQTSQNGDGPAILPVPAFPTLPTGPAPAPSSPPEKINSNEVHPLAVDNEVAAEKKYGGKINIYTGVLVLKIAKDGNRTIVVGFGAQTMNSRFERGNLITQLGALPGSEFKIKRGAEAAFADLKNGDSVDIRARYVGTAHRPGAWRDTVVLFEDAELVAQK
jgi:hypothetical protein